MYLARKRINQRTHYFLRESYWRKGAYRSRELAELGTDPGRHIVYPGGNAYYIDERLQERVRAAGGEPDGRDLDDIFWDFLRPDIRRVLTPFRRQEKAACKRRQFSEAQVRDFRRREHPFDRRRLYFLRCGGADQRGIERTPARFFRVLWGKSRDELEQQFIAMERRLSPREYKTYVYVVFDLQAFMGGGPFARKMPHALDQDRIDAFFLVELCELNGSTAFWGEMPVEENLHEYLVRYAVMFFDYDYGPSQMLDEFAQAFMNSRRAWRPPVSGPRVSLNEASTIFGITPDELSNMSRRRLTRHYRRLALKIHPDQGGSHEQFIRLSEAYKALLRGRSGAR